MVTENKKEENLLTSPQARVKRHTSGQAELPDHLYCSDSKAS